MLGEVLLATTGPDGGVSLIDIGSGDVRDRIALPDATFLISAPSSNTYYALHGDDRTGHLTRLTLEDGRLRIRETVSTVGAEPCHGAFLADGAIAVACYDDSRVSVFEFAEDGAVQENPRVLELAGEGPDRSRQERAHPHFIAAGLGGHEMLVVDLGSDVVWAIDRQGADWNVAPFATVHPGAGPRHAVVVADTLLLTGELSARVSTVSLGARVEEHSVAATGLPGDEPAYLGDVCLVSGRAAVAVRGRSSVSLFDLATPARPRLVQETVIPGSWPQQLHPVNDGVIVVDRDGGRLVDLDPVAGAWQTLVDGLDKPMWMIPVASRPSA